MFRHRAVRNQGGRRALAAILAAGVVAGLLVGTPVAQAAPAAAPPTLAVDASPDTSGKPVARITMDMAFDCEGMSGEVLANAVERDECPAPGEATTNGTTVGNCGASWIDIYDDVPGDKVGRVVWGMSSYQGTIVYRSLLIEYFFTTQDQGIVTGALVDSGVMLSSTYQASATATSPLPSLLAVIMSGGVRLLTGSSCVIIPPRDTKPVS